MRSLNDLLDGHLVHLILLAPAVLFGLGVFLFSRRQPTWDQPPTASPAADDLSADSPARPDCPSGSRPAPTGPDDHLG